MKTLAPSNTRTYRVRTRSGIWGWRSRLRTQYATPKEFAMYDLYNGLARRLGYRSPRTAWQANPVIEGSVRPDDYRRVSA